MRDAEYKRASRGAQTSFLSLQLQDLFIMERRRHRFELSRGLWDALNELSVSSAVMVHMIHIS